MLLGVLTDSNNSECPKQKAIICLPEVRKASFGQECVLCQRGGANNYISTGKVEGINNKKSDEAKCIWI